MPLPITVAAAPAAIAGLAYLNAKTSFSYDYNVYASIARGFIKSSRLERRDQLNTFYTLESRAQDKKSASTTFLVYEGKKWTYKETYDLVLRYGNWLKETYDIQKGEVVAMYLGNSSTFIFLWFGLWAIGANPAFINYNLVGKALIHCVRASTARVLFLDLEFEKSITEEVQNELPSLKHVVLSPEIVNRAQEAEATRHPDELRSGNKARDMAILIFTSGTTGLPKPAIVSWSKCALGANMMPSWMGFQSRDIIYSCMPLYHTSASLLGVVATLNTGASIVIGRKFSTSAFWREVRDADVTIIQYVGETCRYLLAAPPQHDPITGENLDRKNKVRLAFGNGLRPDIWNEFKERFDIAAIAEFYAATEGHGALWNFSKNDFSRGAIGRSGTLGWLLSGSRAIVALDWETEQPWRDPKTGLCKQVTRGDPGELLYKLDAKDIKKAFQGYFNNDKATESKIFRDVLAKGDAYFRTGDMVRWDPEGRTYFSDRIGDTFRWKAENVSTTEVQEALCSHEMVQEANVYGVQLPHHDGRAGCAAIVLANELSDSTIVSLAAHTHEHLPRFAIPLFLRITSNIEMTGTNKQLKHVVRAQGVDPKNVGDDTLYWLRNGTYSRFSEEDWNQLNRGQVKL